MQAKGADGNSDQKGGDKQREAYKFERRLQGKMTGHGNELVSTGQERQREENVQVTSLGTRVTVLPFIGIERCLEQTGG